MKQQTKTTFSPLTKTAINALCIETRETNLSRNELRKFSAVDLWHIQKNSRLSRMRRHEAI
jgi:hypothetical protein